MISIEVISQVKEKVAKDKEESLNIIKHKIERKTELERLVRVGEESRAELEKLEKSLKIDMCKYVGFL